MSQKHGWTTEETPFFKYAYFIPIAMSSSISKIAHAILSNCLTHLFYSDFCYLYMYTYIYTIYTYIYTNILLYIYLDIHIYIFIYNLYMKITG